MVLREEREKQELRKPRGVPAMLRRAVLAALPSGMLLGAPLLLDGCICPTHDVVRGFLLPPGEMPKSHEECVALCQREIRSMAQTRDKHDPFLRSFQGCDVAGLTEVLEGKVVPRFAIRCAYKVTHRCIGGRLPAGVSEVVEREDAFEEIGAYFSQLCYLERAAVEAFRQLAHELSLHGAPKDLISRASRAIREEEEHAEITGMLASLWGGEFRPLVLSEVEPRSLLELAYDNAVEGCVRETYAPLTAHWQALHAPDVLIRASMQRIAEDEAGHAALSWDIEDWLSAKLSSAEHTKMLDLREEAIFDLERAFEQEPAAVLIEQAGLPDSSASLALLNQAKEIFFPPR